MKIEKIKFERTGGFAGIPLTAEIEMDELPEEQRKEILDLIDEIDIDEVLGKLGSKPSMPDQYTYTLVVTTEHIVHTITSGDSTLPDEAQPLIELLEGIAKRQMRKNKRSG